MSWLRSHAKAVLSGALLLGALSVAGYTTYSRTCCAPGASCCYPGSPCCAGAKTAQK